MISETRDSDDDTAMSCDHHSDAECPGISDIEFDITGRVYTKSGRDPCFSCYTEAISRSQEVGF